MDFSGNRLELCLSPGIIEAGCDEAGRGPLAGPVFAAAVILPEGFRHPLLDDSKKMTAKARETVRDAIVKEAVSYAVEAVSAEEIDRINILNASVAGMWRAVCNLSVMPQALSVDGNRFRKYSRIPEAGAISSESLNDMDEARETDGRTPWFRTAGNTGTPGLDNAFPPGHIMDGIPFRCIIKGDGKFMNIAAASVLAKTARDRYMKRLAQEYPQYGWDRNMGYPTREHIEAIRRYGLTPHHRKSFHVRELEPTLF